VALVIVAAELAAMVEVEYTLTAITAVFNLISHYGSLEIYLIFYTFLSE